VAKGRSGEARKSYDKNVRARARAAFSGTTAEFDKAVASGKVDLSSHEHSYAAERARKKAEKAAEKRGAENQTKKEGRKKLKSAGPADPKPAKPPKVKTSKPSTLAKPLVKGEAKENVPERLKKFSAEKKAAEVAVAARADKVTVKSLKLKKSVRLEVQDAVNRWAASTDGATRANLASRVRALTRGKNPSDFV
jgi:hypothetical protein